MPLRSSWYHGSPATRRAELRGVLRVIRKVLTRPLGRIQRAAERHTAEEMAAALERPPSRAPVWALRALAVSEAAPLGGAAVVEAACEAVYGDQKKLRASMLTPKKKRRPRPRPATSR